MPDRALARIAFFALLGGALSCTPSGNPDRESPFNGTMNPLSRIQAVLESTTPVAHVLFHADRTYDMRVSEPEKLAEVENAAARAYDEFHRILVGKLGQPTKSLRWKDITGPPFTPIESWASLYDQWSQQPDRHYILWRAHPDEPEVPLFIVFGVHDRDPQLHQNAAGTDPWSWQWQGDPYAPDGQ